jgi:starch phosphorylase
MKASMAQVGKEMNSHRMLIEYSEHFYLPALEKAREFAADKYASAGQIAAYLQRLKKSWVQVKVESLSVPEQRMYKIADNVEVSARINLGGLSSQEVRVELYYGSISSSGTIEHARSVEMTPQSDGQSTVEYRGQIECGVTGRQGYTVRLLPKHPALIHPYVPGYLRWA